jgi:hypothetical protein
VSRGRPYNGNNKDVYEEISKMEIDSTVIVSGMNRSTLGNFLRGYNNTTIDKEMIDKLFKQFSYEDKIYVTRVK